MPYLPNIPNYKPFYIQMEGETAAFDTAGKWGMILKSSPYPVFPNPKERYSIDWKDEDGLYVYGSGQYLDAAEFSVEFLMLKTDYNSLTSQRQIRQTFTRFIGTIRAGYFSIYDSYTGVGLQKVRYVGFTQSDYWYDGTRTGYVFSVQMVCDDPLTRMSYYDAEEGGAIAEYSNSATLPSVFYPVVNDYKPFYVQYTTGASASDTRTTWGLTAKAEPVPVIPNAKKVYREKNYQADGDLGFASEMFEPIEFKVDFFIKAYADTDFSAEEIVLSRILEFRTFLVSGRLMVYDSYTDFGKTDVEYAGGSVETFGSWDDAAWAIFSVNFRANDPTTNVVYSDGVLEPENYVGLNSVASENYALYDAESDRLAAINQ